MRLILVAEVYILFEKYNVRPSSTKIEFFPENPSIEKGFCFSMWDWPNILSMAKSIFIAQTYFHWSNLLCEIYDVPPVPQKLISFRKLSHLKNALFVNAGLV